MRRDLSTMRFSTHCLQSAIIALLLYRDSGCVAGFANVGPPRQLATLRGGSTTQQLPQASASQDDGDSDSPSNSVSPHDFTAEASALFGNIRIPAALFAGASTASAFALPLLDGIDGLKMGMVKRLYALCMITALSSQVVAVIVSTLSVMALSTGCKQQPQTTTNIPSTSLNDFLMQHCELEWLCTRLHFIGGVLLFSLGIGLRAWVTVSCPVFGKTAMGVILSSTLLCLSFWRDLDHESNSLMSLVTLPWKYYQAAWKKSKSNRLFAVTLIFWASTLTYMLVNLPHVAKYLIQSTATK